MRIAGVTRSSTVACMIVPWRPPPQGNIAPLPTASRVSPSRRSAASGLMTEPSTMSPERGSPEGSDDALATKRSPKASAIASSTTTRSVDVSIWPWFMRAPKVAALAASSRSASSSTTSGALPRVPAARA
jgi:hypothetical protein